MGSDRFDSIQDMKCTIVVTTEVQGDEDVTETFFAMKKPSRYRSEDKDTIKVKNGENVWVYHKDTGEVKTGDLSGVSEADFGYANFLNPDVLEKSEKEYVGDDEIEGRNCFIVRLIPMDSDSSDELEQEQKIWVDKEFLYPLRIEMNMGMAHMTLEHRDVKFNSGLSDHLFELESE